MAREQARDLLPLAFTPPDGEAAARLESGIWSLAARDEALVGVSMTLATLARTLFDPAHPWGLGGPPAASALAHCLAAHAVIRLRRAACSARPQRWACRVLRILPPHWIRHVQEDWEVFVRNVRGVINGVGVAASTEAAGVYVLFSHSALYVGKFSALRRRGFG